MVRACILLMWSGAVNRQPGYRARNLQRRGYRAPPPRAKISSGLKTPPRSKIVDQASSRHSKMITWSSGNLPESILIDSQKVEKSRNFHVNLTTWVNLPLDFWPTQRTSIDLRLSGNLSNIIINTRLETRMKTNCGISSQIENFTRFFS